MASQAPTTVTFDAYCQLLSFFRIGQLRPFLNLMEEVNLQRHCDSVKEIRLQNFPLQSVGYGSSEPVPTDLNPNANPNANPYSQPYFSSGWGAASAMPPRVLRPVYSTSESLSYTTQGAYPPQTVVPYPYIASVPYQPGFYSQPYNSPSSNYPFINTPPYNPFNPWGDIVNWSRISNGSVNYGGQARAFVDSNVTSPTNMTELGGVVKATDGSGRWLSYICWMFEPSLLLESPGRRDENITRICSSWNDSDLNAVFFRKLIPLTRMYQTMLDLGVTAPELENAIDQSNMTYQDAARTVGLLRRQAHGNSSTPISHPLTLESDNPVQKRPQIQYENLPASSTSAASQQADRRVSSLPVTPTLIPIDQMSLVQQLRTKSLSQEVKLAAMRKDDLPSKNLDPYQKVYLASGTVNHLEEESNKKGFSDIQKTSGMIGLSGSSRGRGVSSDGEMVNKNVRKVIAGYGTNFDDLNPHGPSNSTQQELGPH